MRAGAQVCRGERGIVFCRSRGVPERILEAISQGAYSTILTCARMRGFYSITGGALSWNFRTRLVFTRGAVDLDAARWSRFYSYPHPTFLSQVIIGRA